MPHPPSVSGFRCSYAAAHALLLDGRMGLPHDYGDPYLCSRANWNNYQSNGSPVDFDKGDPTLLGDTTLLPKACPGSANLN